MYSNQYIYTADSLYNNTLYNEYLDIRTKSFIPITKNEYTIKIDLLTTMSVPPYNELGDLRSSKVMRFSCHCSG